LDGFWVKGDLADDIDRELRPQGVCALEYAVDRRAVRRPGSSSKYRYVGVAKDAYPAWSGPLSTVQGRGKRRLRVAAVFLILFILIVGVTRAPRGVDIRKNAPICGLILRNGKMTDKASLDEETAAKLAGLANALRPLQAELGLPQLLALLTIAGEPGLSVNGLADRLDLPQQTASRHVAALAGRYQGVFDPVDSENSGRSKLDPLISQEISESDPRRRALFISKQGRALLDGVAKRLGPVSDGSRRKKRETA
jgi:DNA-binding MarR family transcriptional regulator